MKRFISALLVLALALTLLPALTFAAVPDPTDPYGPQPDDNIKTFELLMLAAGALVVLAVIAVVIVILVKKKKKAE